jgi:hypothetical protein
MRRRLCPMSVSPVLSHRSWVAQTKRLPRIYQTYSSTSLRCTDFVPPHIGIVKVREGDSAIASFRSAQGGARARSCYTHKGCQSQRGGGCGVVRTRARVRVAREDVNGW